MSNKVIKRPIAQPAPSPPSSGASGYRPSLSGVSAPKKATIIEREKVDATSEARRIKNEAEQAAAQLLEEAQSQAEDLRQQGYNEGYQEGLGRYTEQTTRALLAVEKFREAMEPEFIQLVRTCVEKIIGQELKLHPDAVIGLVRNVLKEATQQREIVVRIHPDDAETLRKKEGQRRLLDVLARANTIEVREDPAITRGGCVIVTELGTIDASLERQMQALEAVLMDELEKGGDAPSSEDGEASEEEEQLEEEYEE